MPREEYTYKTVLVEQEHRVIEWLSHLNLVEFIRLEIPRILNMCDEDELQENKKIHFFDICTNPESFEVQEIADTLIRLMPESYQQFHCVREDVCEHLAHYLPTALAPL